MGSQRQHLKSFQTSKMELFAKMVDGLKLLTNFKKCRTFDAWQCSQYVFGSDNIHIVHISATSFQPSGGDCSLSLKTQSFCSNEVTQGFCHNFFSICNTLHKKMKFSIKDFFWKWDQTRKKLGICYWRNVLRKTSFKFSVNSYKKICLTKTWKLSFKCDELDKKNYEKRL